MHSVSIIPASSRSISTGIPSLAEKEFCEYTKGYFNSEKNSVSCSSQEEINNFLKSVHRDFLYDNKIPEKIHSGEQIILPHRDQVYLNGIMDRYRFLEGLTGSNESLLPGLMGKLGMNLSLREEHIDMPKTLEKPFIDGNFNNTVYENLFNPDKFIMAKNLIIYCFGASISRLDEKSQEEFWKNVQMSLIFIADIESGGGNSFENKASGASGPLQYKDGYIGVEYDDRGFPLMRKRIIKTNGSQDPMYSQNAGLYSPFDTALRRLKRTLNDFGMQIDPWVNEAYNDREISPLSLTHEQTVALFLGDMMGRGKDVKGKLWEVFANGSQKALLEIYEDEHHTNPDENTLKLIRATLGRYNESGYFIE